MPCYQSTDSCLAYPTAPPGTRHKVGYKLQLLANPDNDVPSLRGRAMSLEDSGLGVDAMAEGGNIERVFNV